MVLPQHAPYTDPLRLIMCGGSTGPGPAQPLDNCVTIAPEAANATWTIERMVSLDGRLQSNPTHIPASRVRESCRSLPTSQMVHF